MGKIIDVINFRLRKSLLPLDVVIMAGGKGMRLRPLTEKTPKPLSSTRSPLFRACLISPRIIFVNFSRSFFKKLG